MAWFGRNNPNFLNSDTEFYMAHGIPYVCSVQAAKHYRLIFLSAFKKATTYIYFVVR